MAAPVENLTLYRCEDCGHAFPAPQGSRRRYCADCLIKRFARGPGAGRPRKDKPLDNKPPEI